MKTPRNNWLGLADVLTCGLAAILLLYLALASKPLARKGVPGKSQSLSFEAISTGDGEPSPKLTIRLWFNGSEVSPANAVKDGRAFVDPPYDGATQYTVIFVSPPTARDRIVVALNDLRQRAVIPNRFQVRVQMLMTGKSVSDTVDLLVQSPAKQANLEPINDGQPLSWIEVSP